MYMTDVWKLVWNKKIYNYEKILEDFKLDKVSIIKQKINKTNKYNLPQVGDSVIIYCDEKKLMKCRIISGCINCGDYENPYNITGAIDDKNSVYLKIKIMEVYINPIFYNEYYWSKL